MSKYYRMRAEIDLTAIRKNIEMMRSYIPEGKKLLAVIKANAYGHGAVEVARSLTDLADYYGVELKEILLINLEAISIISGADVNNN
mgnify:CR=1 FL=1